MPESDPVKLPFPVKGLDANWARADQPPLTSPDLLNVMPYDATDRGRGGLRPGTSQMWPAGAVDGDGAPVSTGGELAAPTDVPGSCPEGLAASYTLAYVPITAGGSDAWSEGHVYTVIGAACEWSRTGIGGAQMSATLSRGSGYWELHVSFDSLGASLVYRKTFGATPLGTYASYSATLGTLDGAPATMRIDA